MTTAADTTTSRPLPDGPSPRDLIRHGLRVGTLAASVAAEKIKPPQATGPAQTPPTLQSVTKSWLQSVLAPAGTIDSIRWSDPSSGTSARARLHISYDRAGAGPETLFAKSTPTVFNRIANVLSGTSATEAGFYRELRPKMEVPAPIGYHSSLDERRGRSLHLIEDVAATKGAHFCQADRTAVTREHAESMVDTLAALHGSDVARRVAERPPAWLVTYNDWWQRGIRLANLRKYHGRGISEGEDFVAVELRGRADATWDAFVGSIEAHDNLGRTVIHNDVHLGNWYRTADRGMELADWQCCAVGHWSRDLAYCLATACATDDRRAWERDLIRRYLDALGKFGADTTFDEAFDFYRRQMAAALLMWTPTYSPPKLFPDMQPRSISAVMLQRITTAMVDLDTLGADRRDSTGCPR